MIERPDIRDETIITALNRDYSIKVSEIEFLPVGNDSTAFAYRLETENGQMYFLKLKRNLSNFAGLFVPCFLKASGIQQILAPLTTKTGKLWVNVDEFSIILYPFIPGHEAMKVGMTDAQWTEFGSLLKRIHIAEPPSDITQYIKRETFVPKWSELSKELYKQVNSLNYDDPYQKELAAFWKENNGIIQTLIERTESIGKRLQQADLEFVLCHADIHTANIILTPGQEMFIVDWDDTLFAPKERDLMFVLDAGTIRSREEKLFFDGYGEVDINQLVLAYYLYEWCVQEIGDFGERVFLTKDTGETTKQDSVEGFTRLFRKGDVIETALGTKVDI